MKNNLYKRQHKKLDGLWTTTEIHQYRDLWLRFTLSYIYH